MGMTMGQFYGGSPPGAAPMPASINMGVDPLNDTRMRRAVFWVIIFVTLAAIRLLYEYADEI